MVDDDADFLSEFSEALISSGYEVRTVNEPSAAVKAAREMKPGLILLDLMMNNTSGFQVASKLKELPETKDIPIIAVTAFFNEEPHQLFINMFTKELGILGILKKPFSITEVFSKIKQLEASL